MTIQSAIITIIFVLTVSHSPILLALSCGDAVTSDTTLTEDLHCTSGYVALEVFASNVTIDLNGFTLSGTADVAGIRSSGYDSLTIKNGSIRGFWVGVNTGRTNDLEVSSITFYEVGHGVIISQGNNADIHDNDFIRTRNQGVFIVNRGQKETANRNIVNNNEFYEAQFGIEICGDQSDNNIITNNLLWKTVDYGIHLNHSDHNILRNNRVLDSDGTALRLNNSSYNRIESNSLREGAQTGISILAKAGDACLASGSTKSYKNTVLNNHSIGFETGIILGLGVSKNANVMNNLISGNKIYNNHLGILFNLDSHNNNAVNNAYQGTIVAIVDEGVGNLY
jgi:parallel beta-helix repeat protein